MAKVKFDPVYVKIQDLIIRKTLNTMDNPDYNYSWDLLREDLIDNGLREPIHVHFDLDKYYLINGAHRIQILERLYGDTLEVPIRIQSDSEKYRQHDDFGRDE